MNFVSEHRLPNDPRETRRVAHWVEVFSAAAQLDAATRHAIDLALEEWVANVIGNAWDDGLEHWLTIRFAAGDGGVRVEVEDDGRPFNPLNAPPVDITEPLDTRPIGGLGIHMIRRLMDAVEYRRENGRNILTLVKRTN